MGMLLIELWFGNRILASMWTLGWEREGQLGGGLNNLEEGEDAWNHDGG